jgi:lipoprotein-anchoring transpeptidase ErfK/SrfK
MTSADSPNRWLEDAIRAARAGNRAAAYQMLRRVIDADPSNESAWLWLAAVTDQPREARLALRRVEQLNPSNPRLPAARQWLEARSGRPPIAAQPPADDTPHTGDEVEPVRPAEDVSYAAEAEAATHADEGSSVTTALVDSTAEGDALADQAAAGTLPEPAAVTASDLGREEAIAAQGDEPADLSPRPPDTKPVAPVASPADSSVDLAEDQDTAPRTPVTEEPPATPLPGRRPRRACRFWLTLALALALATALAVLAFAIWLRTDASGFGLLATPTPDALQRALALQPDANAAIAEGRWADAVTALETIHALDPHNATWQHSAANAYYQLGVERRRSGDLAAAVVALDRAVELAPDVVAIRQEQQQTAAVLEGLRQYERRDWKAAIATLTPVQQAQPSDAEVTEWLYSAYFNLAADLQADGALEEAEQAYRSALALRPDRLTVRQRLEEISWLLRPPTPTVTPTPTLTPTPTPTPTPDPASQLILVDISEQRMYVYENNQLLWEWVASTGEPGKDTATGRYQILDKIDVAYASTWNLDMPYWLGIYYSGPLENGIHALPINRTTGLKLWEGLLGQRVSFGCVILSDENARTLYEWAQVGTPVIIQW